ncbi:MAG TPA: sulfate adenylyltransferase, partial [Candidatus Caldiarchaeum subterraneum]|nr:sulfate adenylyltransferase [Candidatus Caldarchaeum subterraneum]
MVAKPHGGRLVNRAAEHSRLERLRREAEEMPKISISAEKAIEVENIANGVYSPLEGFMTQDDYQLTLDNMRLSNDIPWSIPIVLDVDEREVEGLREGDD